MLFSFTVNQALYLALAREDARAAGRRARGAAADPARLPVGALRAQPRRAHARQALGRRARGGVRRVRARPRDADVRARPAPAAAVDARRRPAAHAARLLADVLAARHAGAVLRRGDRHGREPRDRGPLRGARADAVVGRAQRRLHDRATSRAGRCSPTGPFGFPEVNVARQRREPGLAAQLDGAADPPPPRVPGARLGRAGRCSTQDDPAVFAHRVRLGRVDDRRRAQPRRAGRREARLALDAEGVLVDLFGTTSASSTAGCRSRSSPTASAGSGCAGRGSGSRPSDLVAVRGGCLRGARSNGASRGNAGCWWRPAGARQRCMAFRIAGPCGVDGDIGRQRCTAGASKPACGVHVAARQRRVRRRDTGPSDVDVV